MKKFTLRELAEMYNIPIATLSDWLKKGKFVPDEYHGARKPCFYYEAQLPKLEELIKTDYFPRRKKEPSAIATAEFDTEKLIAEPLEQKSLEELAEEANLYTARGDDCLKQGLTFYFAAGRRLNEAKNRLEHGQWQNWLAENFSASADTASNYMKLARRFGESKSETFRNLGLATAIKMLALPEGTEEDFAREQAEAGNPIEKQSSREIQRNIKTFKAARAKKTEEPPPDLSNSGETFSIFGRETHHDNSNDSLTCFGVSNSETFRILEIHTHAIRELIEQTDDLQTIKAIRDSLLKLVSLADAKFGELSKKIMPQRGGKE